MTSAYEVDISQNFLLGALRPEDRRRLLPHLVPVEMSANALLVQAGQEVTETWFPIAGALAAFSVLGTEGQSVDVAFVGREGALGGIVSHGQLAAYSNANVRVAGLFLKINTGELERAKVESITLRHWFARYADCLLAQVFQTAACNAIHSIRQRVARTILAGLERSGQSQFAMTQDQLANMLGVGRTFISRVLGTMREEGIIETRRGYIAVTDMKALTALSCDCNSVIEAHFHHVMGGLY